MATAYFARGPWLYVRSDSNGKTGYIPRMICSLYDQGSSLNDQWSKNSLKKNVNEPQRSKGNLHRYFSQSSALIADQQNPSSEQRNNHLLSLMVDEQEHRITATLPRSKFSLGKDRRLTRNFLSKSNQDFVESPHEYLVTRDTDSSSTQDSGFSESTPFYLVQSTTPDADRSIRVS